MIYWVTQTATSSARLYYEAGDATTGLGRVEVPTGAAIFPYELFIAPRAWAEASLQHHPLDRDAAGRALRGNGAAGALRRRSAQLLPDGPLTRGPARGGRQSRAARRVTDSAAKATTHDHTRQDGSGVKGASVIRVERTVLPFVAGCALTLGRRRSRRRRRHAGLRPGHRTTSRGAVAVSTFANVTRDPADDWLGEGIAETVAADLAAAGLTVVGRGPASSTVSAGAEPDASPAGVLSLGRTLGARWIVTGGYQRLGERLRITARLVDVDHGSGAPRRSGGRRHGRAVHLAGSDRSRPAVGRRSRSQRPPGASRWRSGRPRGAIAAPARGSRCASGGVLAGERPAAERIPRLSARAAAGWRGSGRRGAGAARDAGGGGPNPRRVTEAAAPESEPGRSRPGAPRSVAARPPTGGAAAGAAARRRSRCGPGPAGWAASAWRARRAS